MIYVVAGTLRHPFSRLLLSLNEAKKQGRIKPDLYGQYGSFRPEFKLDAYTKKRPIFPYQQHIEWIKDAEMVICEASEDIVLLSLMLGKVPVVLPRRKKYQEHVDDHQVEFVEMLDSTSRAVVVPSEEELAETVRTYPKLVLRCQENLDKFSIGNTASLQLELKVLLETELYKGLSTMQMANI